MTSRRIRIATVTPSTAMKWLETTQHNRHLREGRVVWLANQLKRGEWKLTNDAITIDANGHLINGQHRLNAIILADQPAELIVLTGIPTETQQVIDTNLSRSLADALRIKGEHNVFTLSAALHWTYRLWYIEQTGNVHYTGQENRPTTPRLLKILDDNPNLRDSLKNTRAAIGALRLRPGVTVALHYRMNDLNSEDTRVFFELLATGVELKAKSPILLLRRWLLANQGTIGKPRPRDFREGAMVAKAWNYWREGREISHLTWHYGGSGVGEPFPLPM